MCDEDVPFLDLVSVLRNRTCFQSHHFNLNTYTVVQSCSDHMSFTCLHAPARARPTEGRIFTITAMEHQGVEQQATTVEVGPTHMPTLLSVFGGHRLHPTTWKPTGTAKSESYLEWCTTVYHILF